MAAPITAVPSAPLAAPSATSQPTVRKKLRVAELDLLRFIAAFAVMFYHFTYRLRAAGSTDLVPGLGRIGMHGYLGVNLFFMISGFVILWTARERSPLGFVESRITRLYPEFWIAVLLSSMAFTATAAHEITWRMILANLTMVPSFFGQEYVDGVYWTLLVELKFYALLWALSVARQMPHVERWVFAWLASAVVCATGVAPHALASLTIYPYSPLFIAGGLFFLIRSDGLTWSRGVAVVVALVLAVRHAVSQMPGFVQPEDITSTARVETALVIVSAFAAFTFIAMHTSTRVPFAATVSFLGMLTYPLYLLHNIGKFVFLRPLAPLDPYVAILAAIAFSLAVSALMVAVVERRWRPRFAAALHRTFQVVLRSG